MMTAEKLPKLTEQPILLVDLTPNAYLPLRILRAYRQNCNCNWAEDSDGGKCKNPLLVAMNKDNAIRAAILDIAIAQLEEESK